MGRGILKGKMSSLSKGVTHPATVTSHFDSEEGDLIGCIPVSRGVQENWEDWTIT